MSTRKLKENIGTFTELLTCLLFSPIVIQKVIKSVKGLMILFLVIGYRKTKSDRKKFQMKVTLFLRQNEKFMKKLPIF